MFPKQIGSLGVLFVGVLVIRALLFGVCSRAAGDSHRKESTTYCGETNEQFGSNWKKRSYAKS